MRAAFYERTGPARADPRRTAGPEPNRGEVRVRVAWSGVNPSDVKSRAGLRTKAPPFPRVVPHSDGSGTIDRVGEGVDPARIGERVWVWNAAWGAPRGRPPSMSPCRPGWRSRSPKAQTWPPALV